MKKIFYSLLLACLGPAAGAQKSGEVGKIALSVVMPENVEGLDESQLSKLEGKLIQIITASGIGATGFNNTFVIYPKYAIYETNVVEGGMQNITVVTSELSLYIKQAENNIMFASISKPLKGSGSNKALAINNAISKIGVTDADYKTFVETGKSKILAYYESKCGDIMTKADAMAKRGEHESAIGLLMSVPEVVSCYAKVQAKAIEVYKAYQNKQCAIALNAANTQAAANNYTDALQSLSTIDPGASCFKDAQALMRRIDSKVDAEQKKQWDFKMKAYSDEVSLQKMRINAVKDVAVAYYSNRPSINYNIIVR